ncbi:MAG: 16S rRNA (guanine(966)-N(2))-methyltransferase RsmD [Candidatus Dadabacteria bacterium]|nr:16S rRNA (guanine(966)-N(2))-methyltransferase RsmD [Candidatus Dadabacteria bacterium]
MRVLAGKSKGKRLKVPGSKSLRPTSSRIKKSMFDILGPKVTEARVLDLFAGSGSLGIEALSLGAAFCVFVEKNLSTAEVIDHNLHLCGYRERSRILNFDFRKALSILSAENRGFDIVFVDPPYEFYEKATSHSLVQRILEAVGGESLAVIEHPSGKMVDSEEFFVKTRKYGGTSISFLRRVD